MSGASILGHGTKIEESLQTLGISRDMLRLLSDSQVPQVVAANYRTLAMALHPDLNPEARDKFTEVSNAYQLVEPLLSDGRLPQILQKLRDTKAVSSGSINVQREAEQKLGQATREIEKLQKLFIYFFGTMERLAPDAKISFPGSGRSTERLPLFAYGVYTFNMVEQEGVENDADRGAYEIPAKYRPSISTDSAGVIVKVQSKSPELQADMQHLMGSRVIGAVEATVLQGLKKSPTGNGPADQLRIAGAVQEQQKMLPFEISRQEFTKTILPHMDNTVGYGDRLVLIKMTGDGPRFFVMPTVDSAGSQTRAAVQFKSGV